MRRLLFACLLITLPLADAGPSCGPRPKRPEPKKENDKPSSPGAGAGEKAGSTDAKSN